MVKNVRYEICPLLALESIAYGFFFCCGREIFRRGDISQEGLSVGREVPGGKPSRGHFTQGILPDFIVLSRICRTFSLATQFYTWRCPSGIVRGKSSAGLASSGGFFCGRWGIFCRRNSPRGEFFMGEYFCWEGEISRKNFPWRGGFRQ